MAIYNINKKIITITITLAKKGTHWSCAQEPETTYKAQHRGYYLHKNIKLILNYIQLKMQNNQAQCDK